MKKLITFAAALALAVPAAAQTAGELADMQITYNETAACVYATPGVDGKIYDLLDRMEEMLAQAEDALASGDSDDFEDAQRRLNRFAERIADDLGC